MDGLELKFLEEIMEFLVGAIFVVALYAATVFGTYLGMQMAIDYTKRDGHFKSYGRKWRAVEVMENI